MLYSMRRLVPLALPALLLIAACGGGGSDKTVPSELATVCTQGASASAGAISVTSPEFNANVTSPVHVAGTITASGTQFFFSLVDPTGARIADYPGHASATGTPVAFAEDVPFGVQEKTPACLWVYQDNSTGDSPDTVRIPVNLLPAATTTGG